ncbi:unnamed protein product [Oncorhynchus mykiss]|uniref:RGS domain-containing protein n=1 Tax=Oncorhynchus mykiss TaxID=8022 RepID=A0A060X131_ONCMY|nr:unnamed protein product [Oncorhynchus mykiss]
MPKLLFSKIRINEFKDLLQNMTQTRRIDIILSRKRCYSNIRDYFTTITCQIVILIYKTHLMQKRVHANPIRFFAAFRSFLQSEFREENIEFWLACRDYRENTSPADLSWKKQNRSTRTQAFHKMLIVIVCVSPLQINVDHHIREKIKTSMKSPGLCCFDEAVRNVYRLMERDSCPRFLRSDAYLGFRRKARTL